MKLYFQQASGFIHLKLSESLKILVPKEFLDWHFSVSGDTLFQTIQERCLYELRSDSFICL